MSSVFGFIAPSPLPDSIVLHRPYQDFAPGYSQVADGDSYLLAGFRVACNSVRRSSRTARRIARLLSVPDFPERSRLISTRPSPDLVADSQSGRSRPSLLAGARKIRSMA